MLLWKSEGTSRSWFFSGSCDWTWSPGFYGKCFYPHLLHTCHLADPGLFFSPLLFRWVLWIKTQVFSAPSKHFSHWDTSPLPVMLFCVTHVCFRNFKNNFQEHFFWYFQHLLSFPSCITDCVTVDWLGILYFLSDRNPGWAVRMVGDPAFQWHTDYLKLSFIVANAWELEAHGCRLSLPAHQFLVSGS